MNDSLSPTALESIWSKTAATLGIDFVAKSTAIVAPCTHLRVILCSGKDAPDFLQRQFTADLAQLEPGEGAITGYCTPKGRLLGIFLVFRRVTDFLLLTDATIADAINARLQLYLLRAEVSLTPLPDWGVLLLGKEAATHEATAEHASATGLIAAWPGVPRYQLRIAPLIELVSLWQMLERSSLTKCGPCQFDLLAIRHGLPIIVDTTSELFIPQAVNLDLIGGVSFNKGCYPGQEIVARVRYLGRLKTRMIRATVTTADMVSVAAPVSFLANDEQKPGVVVSAVCCNDGTAWELLAVVPVATLGTDTARLFNPSGPVLREQSLPYSLATASAAAPLSSAGPV
jgi:folate-binding protein YgfZ